MTDEKREAERVALAQGVRNLRENMPALIELDAMQAVLTRKKFLSLVGAGFTESQALELCKKGAA